MGIVRDVAPWAFNRRQANGITLTLALHVLSAAFTFAVVA